MIKKYNSIENIYKLDFLEKVQLKISDSTKFIVMEKIHGVNLSVCYSFQDKKFSFASRNEILDKESNFYGYLEVFKNKKDLIYEFVKKFSRKKIKEIQLVGELFGGQYGNKRNGTQVQKGVDYCIGNDWLMFDVIIETKKGEIRYLDHKEYINIVKEIEKKFNQKLFVPLIQVGKLKEIKNINVERLESLVYKNYDYSKLEGNIAEGIIIKPLEEICIGVDRVIFKKKSDKFKEKSSEKKRIQKKEKVKIKDGIKDLFQDLGNYITENRVNNVLSKYDIKKIDNKKNKQIIGEFCKDIFLDFYTDNFEKITKFEKEDLKIIKKEIGKSGTKFIQKFLKNL